MTRQVWPVTLASFVCCPGEPDARVCVRWHLLQQLACGSQPRFTVRNNLGDDMLGWFKDLTATERRTMVACFGGWSLDALDVQIFTFVIPGQDGADPDGHVHRRTMDGRTVILSRYTEPELDQAILLQRLTINLADQPPPRVIAADVP